jgi:phosphoglycolate phosphatase
MMKYKLAIFDFDGTLANTMPWFINVSDQLADKHHVRRIDRNEIESLRGNDIQKMMKLFNVPMWKMPLIARDIWNLMAADIEQIPLFDGIGMQLEALAENGMILSLVSSNAFENIRQVLGPEVFPRISFCECGVSAFGKASKLRKVLQCSGVPASETIYIGDEIRDIQAAHEVHIAFGAVAWGYTKFEALLAQGPTEAFGTIEDLVRKLI